MTELHKGERISLNHNSLIGVVVTDRIEVVKGDMMYGVMQYYNIIAFDEPISDNQFRCIKLYECADDSFERLGMCSKEELLTHPHEQVRALAHTN